MNQTAPDSLESQFRSYKFVNTYPTLIVNQSATKTFQADLRKRFINNYNASCPLILYRISKVVANGTVLKSGQYNSIFQVSNNGIFNVLGMLNQNISNWLIYIETFNTKIWGGDKQNNLIDLTLTAFVNNINYTLNKTSFTSQNLNVTIDLFKQNYGNFILNIPAALKSDT